MTGKSDAILTALWILRGAVWPIISLLALWVIYTTGPRMAYQAARGMSDQFITVYDSALFDHTTGKWKPDSNGVWRKVRK